MYIHTCVCNAVTLAWGSPVMLVWGAKTIEVEARVALVCASTDDGRPLTGGTNLIWTVVDWVTSSLVPRSGYEARLLQE